MLSEPSSSHNLSNWIPSRTIGETRMEMENEWERNEGLERGIDSSGFTGTSQFEKRASELISPLLFSTTVNDELITTAKAGHRHQGVHLHCSAQGRKVWVDKTRWWTSATLPMMDSSYYDQKTYLRISQNRQCIFLSYSRFNQEDQKEESNPDNTCHSDQVQDQMLSLSIHFGRRRCWQGWKVEGQFASRWVVGWIVE